MEKLNKAKELLIEGYRYKLLNEEENSVTLYDDMETTKMKLDSVNDHNGEDVNFLITLNDGAPRKFKTKATMIIADILYHIEFNLPYDPNKYTTV